MPVLRLHCAPLICACISCRQDEIPTEESHFMKVRITLSLTLLLAILLAACGSAAPAVPATEPAVTEAGSQVQNDAKTLKIAVLPIIDTLPMYVAEAEGLFAKHGVGVE